jgi:hypothetical protein
MVVLDMELELAMQQVGHSAKLTQVRIVTSVNRLQHMDQCAKVLLAKALRFNKE